MPNKVLVIDDDEGVCDSFILALENTEYVVETACRTGEEGIEKAKNDCPDIIFLDLKMPGIGGIETLRRLREFCLDVPIYIVTAFNNEYLKQLKIAADEGLECEVCNKPIDMSRILEIVDGVLKKGVYKYYA